jgi:hypothetical protein
LAFRFLPHFGLFIQKKGRMVGMGGSHRNWQIIAVEEEEEVGKRMR